MNDKLETQLSNLLTWAEQATSTTATFVAEQTPLYITELLVYNFWLSLICFISFALLLLISIIAPVLIVKCAKVNYFYEISPTILLFIIPIFIGLIGVSENMDWLKIKLAPRVYIVDYLRDEIKNH